MGKFKAYTILVLMVAAGFAAAFLVSQGYYPIVFVGDDFISAKRFAQSYSAASLYYENLVKTYGPVVPGDRIKPLDLELAVMNQLIDESLIREGAQREVGSDLAYLVENKLSRLKDDAELSRAAAILYGLNQDDFVSEVLTPQATRDVLVGRLFLRGEKVDSRLIAARKSARVTIFSTKFRWDGERAVTN